MRRLGAYTVIVLGVLALVVATSLRGSPTAASVDERAGGGEGSRAAAQTQLQPAGGVPPPISNLQTDRPEDAENQPFIGIVIETLSPAEASDLDVSGGVVVLHVLDDGPSAGLLQRRSGSRAGEGGDARRRA